MPRVPEEFGAIALARALKGLNPNDIDSDELDNVIMRIFHELRRQLSQMEAITGKIEAPDRERNARILASLERTAERLVKLEAERGAARKTKAAMIDGHAIEILDARIDRIVAAAHKRARAEEAAERKARETSVDGVETQRQVGSDTT